MLKATMQVEGRKKWHMLHNAISIIWKNMQESTLYYMAAEMCIKLINTDTEGET